MYLKLLPKVTLKASASIVLVLFLLLDAETLIELAFSFVTFVISIYSTYVFEYMLFFVYSSLGKLAIETSHFQRA